VLQRIDHDAAAADHELGVSGLDLQHRAVAVVLDIDVRRNSHALENAQQELARLLGDIFALSLHRCLHRRISGYRRPPFLRR